ncbi:hypothetical protein PR202_ga24327 [Eleusine coracana subsp. coracana]|uniref:HTH myb-type domain-containing protein n=1 Tax=Eleusine coracana subsp. coracana TaxID=191504 RepID=A0AAV5D6L7_ELECO|nr:hypothetical protein PR202_ga24327 [Eleusine coracana subsp. coracana]
MLELSTLRSPSNHAVGFTTDCGDDDESFMVVDDESNLLLDYINFTSCDVVVPSFFDADETSSPTSRSTPRRSSSPSLRITMTAVAPPRRSPPIICQEEAAKRKIKTTRMRRSVTTTDQEDSASAAAGSSSSSDDTNKSSASAGSRSKKTKPSKNSHGKRKVDWTPELHRKFVQAVEQLGIDKAVPSRILEIMGIECLTRHNIASHLQKYRSHRKHLMAREAEAASWAQKRQMYATAPNNNNNKDHRHRHPTAAAAAWVLPPTIGFPPPFSRPLHVWGHPPATAVEAPLLPVWPRHLAPPPSRPWVDPAAAYWHHHHPAARKWGPQTVTQGTPCVSPTMPPPPAMLPRFPAPMPGMMPYPMYRPIPPPQPQTGSSKLASLQLQLNAHPSKESIDAAIGDVLVKPWLPLPLGLKPPSLDSVMSELHKQGISKIPPAANKAPS